MIRQLFINDKAKTPVKYLVDVKQIENGMEFNFKPFINIIVGPNGSGKSTLLKLLERYLLINKDEQGVKQLQDLIVNPYVLDDDEVELYDGADVYSDYAITTFRFCHMNELMQQSDKWMSNFDNFKASYFTMNSSTGQGVCMALQRLFQRMFSRDANLKFPNREIDRLANGGGYDAKRAQLYQEYIKNHRIEDKEENRQVTILMDEPDRNLDITNINEIYPILSVPKDDTQIIAVVHNPLLIYKLSKVKGINWIEMEEGYIDKIKKEIDSIVS